jgi:hypothetical protein
MPATDFSEADGAREPDVFVDTMNLEDALCEVDTDCGNLGHRWVLYAG